MSDAQNIFDWSRKRYVAGPLVGSGSFHIFAIDVFEVIFLTAFPGYLW